VQYTFGSTANPATATFDARFYFNPNGNTGTGQDIFAASTTTGFANVPLHVRYSRNAGQARLQLQAGTTLNATWVNITNAAHRIEVLQSGSTLQMYVDGTLAQTVATSGGSIVAFRLGSVTPSTSATLMYFDAMSAKRTASPLIGP
jgi:hypothetical protein